MKYFFAGSKVFCEHCVRETGAEARDISPVELGYLNGMSDTVCERCGMEESDEVRFVNLTPHEVTILCPGYNAEGTRTFPSVSPTARVTTSQEVVGKAGGFEIRRTTYGQVENLPDPVEGTVYIVSILVAQAAKGRSDVVAPDTGPSAIREDGQIKVVTGFVIVGRV